MVNLLVLLQKSSLAFINLRFSFRLRTFARKSSNINFLYKTFATAR